MPMPPGPAPPPQPEAPPAEEPAAAEQVPGAWRTTRPPRRGRRGRDQAPPPAPAPPPAAAPAPVPHLPQMPEVIQPGDPRATSWATWQRKAVSSLCGHPCANHDILLQRLLGMCLRRHRFPPPISWLPSLSRRSSRALACLARGRQARDVSKLMQWSCFLFSIYLDLCNERRILFYAADNEYCLYTYCDACISPNLIT